MTQRVLIDTNELISYLLQPDAPGAVQAVLRAFLEERFTLLVPGALLQELLVTVRGKRRLAKRIPPQDLTTFIAVLEEFGEAVGEISEPIPMVTRDPKDDYLLAYALVGEADYLVTGDKDLLELQGQIMGLEILTPAQFIDVLA
jgi:putative PIN family toxin of toxin-antitoxin system